MAKNLLDVLNDDAREHALAGLRNPRDVMAVLLACKPLKELLTEERSTMLRQLHDAQVTHALQAGFKKGLDTKTAIIAASDETVCVRTEPMRRVGELLDSGLRKLKNLSVTDLSGTQGHVVQLASGLDSGALPSLRRLSMRSVPEAPMGNVGVSALAAAIDRGAMPLLETLGEWLCCRTTQGRTSRP